jgi:uncharacterized membrane protein
MEFIVFLVVLLIVGWLLGVIAFFRAGRAQREAAAALRELAALRAGLAPPAAMAEPAQPAAAPASPWQPEPAITAAEPEPAAAGPASFPTPPPPARPPTDIEALLTLRWGVWLGAAALLMSGVFLVRYAAEQGLLGPSVRCGMAALLGLALIVAAEWLRARSRGADRPDGLGADQAPPALAAGGVAVLFGAAYGIGVMYALVPPLAGFALLAGVAFAGIGLSLRHGQLVAAIGIAGAFITPALVDTADPSAPGLFAYLLAVSAAALAVVRYAAWTWLGWATTLAGAAWVLIASTGGLGSEYWAPGLFVPALAALYCVLMPAAALDFVVGRRLFWVPFAVLGGSGLLLEAISDTSAPRIGVLLLSPLALWKASAEPRLDRLPWLSALLFLLALLAWALPAWVPTGEVITLEGSLQAVLPGAWAPDAVVPLLTTAAIMAALYAAAGLVFERRAPHPLRWSALTAAVPVLTLAVTYVQVRLFQPDMFWAFAGLALAFALSASALRAARSGMVQGAGVHAAGAAAALALACAMVLQEQWLTLAVSLFLPALAWIEARAELPPLRRVALAVAGLVLIRLLLNWYVLDYRYGTTPVANGLLATYGVPAAAFAIAARMFRRRADDLAVGVLEAGAIAFFTVLVALEIRHATGAGQLTADGDFLEATLHVAAMGLQGLAAMLLARRAARRVLGWAWRIQGGLAMAGSAGLLVFNPLFTNLDGGHAALIAGYLLPMLLAGLAYHAPETAGVTLRRILCVIAVLDGFAWIGLTIRRLYHPGAMGLAAAPIDEAELWAWSGGWLAYGVAVMALGIATGSKSLRLAALGIVGLVAAKAFLIDMAGLDGLWRVLSFLGLGLTLIALGAVYRRFVTPPASVPAR